MVLLLGEEYVLRSGSLRDFSVEVEGSSDRDQLNSAFCSSSKNYQLKIMRDLRLSLAIPLPCDIEANLNPNPLVREFKPLKFSFEGRCVVLS